MQRGFVLLHPWRGAAQDEMQAAVATWAPLLHALLLFRGTQAQ